MFNFSALQIISYCKIGLCVGLSEGLSQIMPTTVMKLLKVTQWVLSKVNYGISFSKNI